MKKAARASIRAVLCLLFACALMACAGAQTETPRRERWAFLVGIADYQQAEFSLLGPRNDVPRMKQMLMERGFAEDHIRLCRDAEATRKGILAGWQWLRQKAKPGDLAVFYYSGHGTVLLPQPGDTSQTIRSALVPYDAVSSAELLPGSDIGTQIDQLATREVVVIVDACHSGRASRMPSVRTRFVPPGRLGLQPEASPKVVRSRGWVLSDFSGKPAKPSGTSRQKEVYLGASRTDQTACEDVFLPVRGDANKNANMGAFTYYLLQEVARDTENRLTYTELVARVRAALIRRYGREQVREDGSRQPTQEPQFSGAATERSIFLQPVSSPVAVANPSPSGNPSRPTPPPTPAELEAPLRVAVRGNLTLAQDKMFVTMPFVQRISLAEPSDAVVEDEGGKARVWRARVPLEPRAWRDVPALLARLHAARMMERLTAPADAPAVVLRVNGEAYADTSLGERVNITVRAQTAGFVTLLVVGADGTLTGKNDMPVAAGQTLSFPATAKAPAGIDFAQVFLTRDPLGLNLPLSPADARSRHLQETARTLVRRLSATATGWGVDTAILRVRTNK